MPEDTLELAENKLLLLYILKKIGIPVSNNKLTQIILENNFINYFILQQYIDELLNSKFILHVDPKNDHRMAITKKGRKVLNLFQNMISKEKIETVDEYFKKHMGKILKHISINADYTSQEKNKFIVELDASGDSIDLVSIKLLVDSDEKAAEICENWKSNYSVIYRNIMKMLLKN